MWRRSKRRRTFAPGTATALAAPQGAIATIATPTEPLKVSFACAADGASCAYAVRGAHWNCSRRTKMACGCSMSLPRHPDAALAALEDKFRNRGTPPPAALARIAELVAKRSGGG